MRAVLTVLVLAACEPAVREPATAPAATSAPTTAPTPIAAPGSVSAGPVLAQPAPLPATPLAAPRLTSGPIGTPHPLVVVAAADSGRWIVACQARADTNGDKVVRVVPGHHGDPEGDRMVGYLMRGAGAGTAIDRFVGASADGRWIAAIVGGRLRLVDDITSQWYPLAADVRDDGNPGRHRSAVFDAAGSHLAYVRAGDDRRVVIRELAAATEREVALPDGLVWRVEPDEAGSWARVAWIRRDSDGDGVLGWPQMQTTAARGMCVGPAMSWSHHGGRGDEPTAVWLRLDSGEIVDDASVVRPLGAVPLVRAADGSIRRGAEVWSPASCAGRIVGVSETPPRAIAVCSQGSSAGMPFLVGPGLEVPLGGEKATAPVDDAPLLLTGPTVCISRDRCVALADGAAVALPGVLTALSDHGWLVKDDKGYLVVAPDGSGAVRVELDGDPRAQAGAMLTVGSSVIDLARKQRVGSFTGIPLAVDLAGRALVATGGDPEVGFATGPLRWVTPR
jgi:hypothetical protein